MHRILALAALLSGCGYRELPPPRLEPTLPANAPSAAAPGQTLFVTEQGPARVSVTGAPARVICETTPCVAYLPPGTHDVTFHGIEDPHRGGRTTIQVDARPSVVKHAPGHRTGRGASTGIGVGSIVLGTLATAGAYLAYTVDDALCEDECDADPTGPVVVGALGVLLVAGGIAMIIGDQPKQQNGATIQWLGGTKTLYRRRTSPLPEF